MMLGDMGAEVIKVEDPRQGDYTRWMSPKIGNYSAFFASLNRNKKSLVVDLKKQEGMKIIKDLLPTCDVLVESFRPGVMQRLGMGYDKLKGLNSRLIYCSITGFGQDGPYHDFPGHDLNYLCYSGIVGLSGQADGEPCFPAVQIADIGGGALPATIAILAALLRREKTNKGQYIDISMLDGAVSWLSHIAADYFASNITPKRGDMELSGGAAIYNVYKTKDGKYLSIATLEPKFWLRFCELTGFDPVAINKHGAGSDDLKQRLKQLFLTRTRDEWMEMLKDKHCCIAPVYELHEVFDDEQVKHREMVVKQGALRYVASPLRFSESQVTYRLPPPQYGEHTTEILESIGYDQEKIDSLRKAKIIR